MKTQIILGVLLNLIFLNFVFCDGNDGTRNLTAFLNPNCKEQLINDTQRCDNFSFVHVMAESEVDIIHYLWNFKGKPSAIVAKTAKNSSLTVNWEKFDGYNKAINFTVRPEYIFSSVINSLYVFNDTMDKGDINDPSIVDVAKFDSQMLQWEIKNITENAGKNKITAEVHASTKDNGTFSIIFTAYGSKKHGDELPHLYHSADSMQVDVIANKIHYNFTSPRIALELLSITSEALKEGSSTVERIRNLDDEFTPGIFDTYHILSPRSDNDSRGGFLQFRPVCYISPIRTVSSSTEISKNNKPKSLGENNDEFENSLPYMFFHKDSMKERLKEALNVTMGMSNDGFYSRTNYISFSYLIGIGAPGIEGLSTFVLIFASVGLGIPLLVLLIGGTYVAVKRYRD